MALRAGALRQVTGIVITASHNPEQDNGVKLVDPSGNMLDSQWEVWLHHKAAGMCSAWIMKLSLIGAGSHGQVMAGIFEAHVILCMQLQQKQSAC